jgi:AraC-like DNA-binding protein
LEKITRHSILSRYHLKAKCRELIVAYASQLEDDIKEPYKSFLSQRQIDSAFEATRIIKMQITSNFTVPGIAKQVFMSPSQLQYCFKLVYGQTVNEYILNVRLRTSRELLKQPDYLITDVVYKVGLNSKSYFSKIFRNKYQESPSQFRRKYLKKCNHESF